jgi:hypothetical protein
MLLPKLVFSLTAIAALYAPVSTRTQPVPCEGCQLDISTDTVSAAGSGYSVTVTVSEPGGVSGAGDGDCLDEDGVCVAIACTVVGTTEVTGPLGTPFSFCRQTGSSQTYCLSPQPTIQQQQDGSIKGKATSTNRVGCGNDYTYSSAVGPVAASCTAECSPCQ